MYSKEKRTQSKNLDWDRSDREEPAKKSNRRSGKNAGSLLPQKP